MGNTGLAGVWELVPIISHFCTQKTAQQLTMRQIRLKA